MGFKEWLEISRDRSYPRSVADILDYATERYHENCGKTVLCSLQAALSVIEIVGRVPESQMFSRNATWMAHIKSMTADLVATSPPEAPASMLWQFWLLLKSSFAARAIHDTLGHWDSCSL